MPLYFNSYLGFTCTITLSENGMTRYESNCYEEKPTDSLFLLNRSNVSAFLDHSAYVSEWQVSYGTGNVIDGYRWHIEIEFTDGTIKESTGNNGKPDDFDTFIANLEKLINKPLDYARLLCEGEYE